MNEMIDRIIHTIKTDLRPADMSFDRADAWVGCVMGLEQVKSYIVNLEGRAAEPEEEVNTDA